jgi:hypothetical protein
LENIIKKRKEKKEEDKIVSTKRDKREREKRSPPSITMKLVGKTQLFKA